MTTIKIPRAWLDGHPQTGSINAWLEARGATVISRSRSERSLHWSITIAEDLSQGQKDSLEALLISTFKPGVEFV